MDGKITSSTSTAISDGTNLAMNAEEEKGFDGKGQNRKIQVQQEVIDSDRPSCGGFTIVRTLGKGGHGVVKLVEKNGQQFAMKIFEPHETEKDAFVAETRAELDLVKEHQIDCIPEYYDFVDNAVWKKKDGTDTNVCYLLMENVQGVELIDFFNNAGERLNDQYCRYIFSKVAIALHKLHSVGLAHRDIKPENIILTDDYKVKLIDLGYGIPLSGRDGSNFLRTYCGSRIYMAPEIIAQQFGHKNPYQGKDIDIFSFGVMILSMRTLHYPFERAYQSDPHYRNLMSGDAAQFWYTYKNLNLTPEFKDLIQHLLQEKPASRPVMADLIGHPWMKGEMVTNEQFI